MEAGFWEMHTKLNTGEQRFSRHDKHFEETVMGWKATKKPPENRWL